jgi:hypothetical protein
MVALSPSVHVAIGDAVGVALEGTVSPLVVVNDNVLMGPSSTSARRHRSLRARYWESPTFPDLNHDLGRLGPICVYLPPSPSALLSLCQICFIAIRREREILVVDLGSRRPFDPHGSDPDPEVVLDAAAVREQHRPPARWSTLEAAFAATLWKLWCRASPTAFSRFCAAGSALHPLISDLARHHAGTFPRRHGEGLTLSRFDELLLRQLSREWSTPVQIIARAMRAGSELWAWISHMGDVHVATRLRAWSHHTRGEVVEERDEHPPNPSELTRWSFRWHPGGEAILETLPSLGAAPPVEIGGAVAYDPARPWVTRAGERAPCVSLLGRARGGTRG